jgi:hypothetical protein
MQKGCLSVSDFDILRSMMSQDQERQEVVGF